MLEELEDQVMRLLYPCDPFEKKKPDEAYDEEFNVARQAGLSCSLYSAEDLDLGDFKPRPSLMEGEEVVYRGWMLTLDGYAGLQSAIEAKGGRMLTPMEQYRHCHHLPEWYPLCEDVTPKTVFLPKDADFVSALSSLGWPAYFVKDYVKSLTTSRGSVAKTVQEVPEIVSLIEKYRGQIEGGICIRQFEDLKVASEERYFVFKKKSFARDDIVPEVVDRIAARIDSPFFSVDIVLAADGTPRLIELGDGQVSDRKKWPAGRFVSIFSAAP
ncbi:MAG: ATP-grasp domain-containing protein [Burkholderiales bacterium]